MTFEQILKAIDTPLTHLIIRFSNHSVEICIFGMFITHNCHPILNTLAPNFVHSCGYLLSQAVLSAHKAVVSAMKPGVNWVDMHK